MDTEDPAYFNRYAYAGNNPYRYVDPDGRQYFPGLSNAFKHEVANVLYGQAPSRGSVQAGLETVSIAATATGVYGALAGQPEVAVPAGVVATVSGYAAAALDEEPTQAIATEAAAQITGVKVAKTFGALATGPFKRGIKSSNDESMTDDILGSSNGSDEGWSFEQRFESLGTTGTEQGFKYLSEEDVQNTSTDLAPQ